MTKVMAVVLPLVGVGFGHLRSSMRVEALRAKAGNSAGEP